MNKSVTSKTLIVASIVMLFLGFLQKVQAKKLSNNSLNIELEINKAGVPYIAKVSSLDNSVIYFSDASAGLTLQNRLSNSLLYTPAKIKPLSGWIQSEDETFYKTHASVKVNDCTFTLHLELMKDRAFVRVFNTVSNPQAVRIKEFPIFSSDLSLSGKKKYVNWWISIDYVPQKEEITTDTHLSLYSRIHSADITNTVRGNVPYWTLETSNSFIGFSLAWSGGWRSSLNGKASALNTDVYLSEDETQLNLKPGERVQGPELGMYFSTVTRPMFARKNWLETRSHLASKLYPKPDMGIPFIYNHWYSVGAALSSQFVKDQLKWFDSYGFDVFMIDDGWYERVGKWTPSLSKFKPNEFENALASVRAKGVSVGLWSNPQMFDRKHPLPSFIAKDQPGRYNYPMMGDLVDYNAFDFNAFLTRHLDTLARTGANWWKFDQDFFSENPPSGKLKSVIAFQNGFAAARKNHPTMIFEACMGGGKMINEFTDRISQIHWIRDGNKTGYIHAIDNIHEALGAMDFLEPQKVQRWTNRIDEIEMQTPDLLKFYCRSSMIGSWGVSSDLYKVSDEQREIVINEMKNYKKLNEIKKYNLVEYSYPTEYASVLPVIFYNKDFTKAAILLYSLELNKKATKVKLKLNLAGAKFGISDVDTKSKKEFQGNNLEVSLLPGQNSAIFFIDKVD